MEEEAEKLAALKKVYADIILNTAKEAASRIMVSERKALRFQQELFASKDEALSMLLRLKQMSDSKIAEVETTSLSQTKRIEELEEQLHKAESEVTDLRLQLKDVQDELKKTQAKPFNREMKENVTPGIEDKTPSQRNIEDNCCSTSENTTLRTEPSGNFQEDNEYLGNPELACIIMRTKEPELYRNGCTQRIRAFEGSLLNRESPLPAQTDDKYPDLKNESFVREEKTKGSTAPLPPTDEISGVAKEKSIGLEELLKQENSCDNDQFVKCLRRFSSRKTRSRYRKAQVTSISDQVNKPRERSILSRCKTYPCPDNSMVESGEELSNIAGKEVQKVTDSHMATTTDMNPQSISLNGVESDDMLIAPVLHNSADEDLLLSDRAELPRQDSKLATGSGIPICNTELANSDSADKITSEATDGAIPAVNDRMLKYTFRRKRKKGSLSCPIENVPPETNNTKRRSGEKQNVAPESQKLSFKAESSRDSRRLAQVARQLISLKEKRWWQ